MKLYIADKTKIYDFNLPARVEDSFLINYVSPEGVSENITLIADNGKWTLRKNQNYIVKKNVFDIDVDIVENLSFYDISFNDIKDPIKMFFYEAPINYNRYSIMGKTRIVIGGEECDIICKSIGINQNQVVIELTNGFWEIKSLDNLVYTYVNSKRILSSKLNAGDIIFIDGIKIIWMVSFILINDVPDKLQVSFPIDESQKLLHDDNLCEPVDGTEKYATLYNDNDVFFHTPRLKSEFKKTQVHIDAPPDVIKDDGPPAILTLGATIMMGVSSSITGIVAIFSVVSGQRSLVGSISEIIICIALILGCILFPILLDKYQRKKLQTKENNRQNKYSEYLKKKKSKINDLMQREKEILFQNNLNSEELIDNIQKVTNKIWSREIGDNDFLTFRLGIGNKKADLEIDATIEDFRIEDDNLKEEVESLVNTKFILNDVPITISAIENRILPIIIDETFSNRKEVIDNIMAQLISFYSGIDLKIVVFTDEENYSKWEYLKYLPHLKSNDSDVRFFATNEDEMKQVSSYLENIFVERNIKIKNIERTEEEQDPKENNQYYKNFDEYYLIVTDNYLLAKRSGIVDKILNSKANTGFSLMMIEESLKNIPSRFSQFIQFKNNESGIFSKDLSALQDYSFKPDLFIGDIAISSLTIANIPASSINLANQLPNTINFLEMYNVGKIDQLNIVNRWTKNDPTNSLKAPIGVHPDGKLFELDLHEKFHGPHGLIAGSTGSGKSEFIISFILSMAVNYHPDEVQFVLIDYKGGGLAGAFENRETGIKIPHLVGTITNLDTGEMNRTLVSINSELKRRQRMFNEARDLLGESTVDIYKYQKFYRDGKVKVPISHLFIISDEFAELKSQQPDFMDELISAARIGRSLGVHLILATQKPSGVVDDQIWSNSKFKICLKVQTSEDSMELLKRSDAASIKETGRFYLQVGFDELFEIGQSAWSGARYIPQDRMEKNIDDSIKIVDNSGNLIKEITDTIKIESQVNYGDQLTNIVKSLYEISKRENINTRQLWLPSIPPEIYLINTIKKYSYKPQPYLINPVIGEYDIPASQLQNILTIDFTNSGNLIIYGNAGTGKENLLMTLVYSICIFHTSAEISLYIMDFGTEVLKIFSSIPQVGDVVLLEENNKVRSLLLMIEREINRRKELFSKHGGSYISYIKNSDEKMPLMMIILNGYETFIESHGDYDDFFAHLVRESSKYGIVFVMTAISPSSVKTKISQSFPNKIATQLSDNFDYKFYLDAPEGLTPSKYFGRGIISMDGSAYEMQSCLIAQKNLINQCIITTFEKYAKTASKTPPIPVIPKVITSDTLSSYIDSIKNVPIGINIYDASVNKFDFTANKISQIIGNNLLIENAFITNFVSIMSSIPNVNVKIIDFVGCISDNYGLDYVSGEFTANISQIENESSEKSIVYILLGVGYIYDKVLDEGIDKLFSILDNLNNLQNKHFIFADNYSSYKRIMKEDWYSKIVNNKSGIWIGKGVDIQNAIKFNSMSLSDVNENFKGLAYVSNNEIYHVIKSLGTEDGGDIY